MLWRETWHASGYVCGLVSAFCVIPCCFVIGRFTDVGHIGGIWSHICDAVRILMQVLSFCWNSSPGLQYVCVWSRRTVSGLMMAVFLGQLSQHVGTFGFCWLTCWSSCIFSLTTFVSVGLSSSSLISLVPHVITRTVKVLLVNLVLSLMQ